MWCTCACEVVVRPVLGLLPAQPATQQAWHSVPCSLCSCCNTSGRLLVCCASCHMAGSIQTRQGFCVRGRLLLSAGSKGVWVHAVPYMHTAMPEAEDGLLAQPQTAPAQTTGHMFVCVRVLLHGCRHGVVCLGMCMCTVEQQSRAHPAHPVLGY